jgi:hypothetical protein
MAMYQITLGLDPLPEREACKTMVGLLVAVTEAVIGIAMPAELGS